MTIIINLFIWLFILPLLTGTVVVFLYALKRINTVPSSNNQPPALLFHSVSDKSPIDQSHITPYKFKQFLSYLNKHNYKTLTAYEMAVLSNDKIDPSESYVSLIFDDGFENFHTNVIPLLEQFNFKAAVFPVATSIGSHTSWDIYKPKKHLSKEQIQKISDAGHEIGSHTLSHPDLVLLSENEIIHELSESKKILEDIIGKPVTSLSFPFGSWNMRVWNSAKKCGYTAAVAYGKHAKATLPVIPVTGIYAFDSLEDIIEKLERKHALSNTQIRSLIMPHFAKGTPVWKFRKNYNIFNFVR